MKPKLTLKDIARELDVSISTVSKALKNSEEISTDTKEKIQAFARLYNYKPNNIAISLKNKRTKNIGVIIPDIVHHFFTTVFRGIEKYANQRGYNVIVCISDESFDREVINMELLANGSIDGFIMALSAETQKRQDFNHLREVTEQGIPLVLFDRVTDQIACDKVIIDDEAAGRDATRRLLESGRRRVALFTTQSYLNVSAKREVGYRKALEAAGLQVDPELILRLPYQYEEEQASEAFFKSRKFDAVLCVNEIFAIRGMRLAIKLGLRVPEDVAFIGFTDGILSRYSTPSLTTVDQRGEAMGERAAEMLIQKVEDRFDEVDPTQFRTEVIPVQLIERESAVLGKPTKADG
ncbi:MULTISPECIES: LacI family DNA-binding transcriptional regulator [Robiginitalea]|uniref:LacI family DNA-binding transcriptional regulator n=1 Tax=Robiginitalea TaxID=252306 RepID=UPI002348F475|nr:MULTISPECIES: LacI family DNA-binding transcriptional regulator [unclassified Robiginitalea]MDC6352850.1 LacI family DNA-binding transcriptional regulator [Robiginitalea sp. PM2]MDC6373984.1 LacI family DNA-binding transcriptional regulator [Robiginitalea sp. SP8]